MGRTRYIFILVLVVVFAAVIVSISHKAGHGAGADIITGRAVDAGLDNPKYDKVIPAAEAVKVEQGQDGQITPVQETPEKKDYSLVGGSPHENIKGGGSASEPSAEQEPNNLANSIITDSQVSLDSYVENSKITDSFVQSSKVINSYVDPSNIINSTIINSTIIDSNITGSTVDNSYVENSRLSGVNVYNANITNNFMSTGTMIFSDNMRITGSIDLNNVVADAGKICINPYDGLVLGNDSAIKLCNGTFNLIDNNSDGIIMISGSHVSIDCQDSEMIGDMEGKGISAAGSLPPEYGDLNNLNDINISYVLGNMEEIIGNITFLDDISIKNCRIRNFGMGMNLMAVTNSIIENNIVDSPRESGILVIAKDTLLKDNEVKDSGSHGIFGACFNTMLTKNVVHGNLDIGLGIFGMNNTLDNNTAYGNRHGIGAAGIRNVIKNSYASNNTDTGISLLFSWGGEAYNNIAEHNKNGIFIAEAINNTLKGNILDDNNIGIMMSGFAGVGPSTGNIIDNNTIAGNLEAGMVFSDGTFQHFIVLIQNVLARSLGSNVMTPQPPGHRIEKNVIASNRMNNTQNILLKSGEFRNNLIIYNEFYGGIINKSLLMQSNDVLLNLGECLDDSGCNDNNIKTLDICKAGTCINRAPTVYGVVVNAIDGAPMAGEQVSVISKDECNAADDHTGEGNCTLEPKLQPDAVTDSQGRFAVATSPGIYSIVVNGSREDTLNRYVGNEVHKITIPSAGTIKVVVEPERIEAGFHSTAYVRDNGYTTKVFEDSHVTQTPVFVNVTQTDNLEFFITVHGTYPMTYGYNLSSIDSNNKVSFSGGKYRYGLINSSNQVIIDQLDADTWRLWYEDLPPGHPWSDSDYNDVVYLIDFTPAGSNITNTTNQTDYDCDNDGIPNYLDTDDSWCDHGQESIEIINETSGDFDAEGHILDEGRYRGDNKYVCGDNIQFVMFGVNNGTANKSITFMIEDHTIEQGVNGTLVYAGNMSLDSQSLNFPNDRSRHEKIFNITLPCLSTKNDGRHDIHIIYNGDKWHKMGDFFVVNDSMPVQIWAESNKTGFTNSSITFLYNAWKSPEPGTIADIFSTESGSSALTVIIDKDITDNNDADKIGASGLSEINITYNQSDHYIMKLTAYSADNKNASAYVNISVYMAENEADAIADPIYTVYSIALEGGYQHNVDVAITSSSPEVNTNADRYDNLYEFIGDEYITPYNGLTQEQANGLQAVIDGCSGNAGGYLKPVYPMTAKEYNETIYSYLHHLQCQCNRNLGGPVC